ncbi:MAG: branched-chain amino acid ABC transporter permease, partial [Streptomyces sp.]|nr:branched-chain amino acid ABC transporter permease [Streptomyces sp.]
MGEQTALVDIPAGDRRKADIAVVRDALGVGVAVGL